jgi:hypothetical protein
VTAPLPPGPGPHPWSPSELWTRLGDALAREPALTGAGIAGLVLAAVCLVGVGVYGPVKPPEGKMLDAATFNLGVGIFLLTIALILPLAGFSDRGRTRARRLFLVFAGYGLSVETVQAFRGMDPRFSPLHGTLDMIVGGVFGITALLLTVTFLVLGLRFFRRDVLADQPLLRLGLRYGSTAAAISFAVGILMSVIQSRIVGEAGNLLPAHGLGVHGIQALPVAALLLAWSGAPRARAWMHVAGLGWLAAVGAVLVQALAGWAPTDPGPLPAVAAAGLLLWTAAATYGALAWARAREPGVAEASGG